MKIYKLELSKRFRKEFKKLDIYTQKMLRYWIEENISNTENPRLKGKALTGNNSDKWSYRIGTYRLICLIEDDKLTILALSVGHRKSIYKNLQ